MSAKPIDEAVVMLEALQERWCDSTTGKPGTRRIATFDAARGAQGEDDFDSEVSATRRCASDLALAIERIRALTAAQQQGQSEVSINYAMVHQYASETGVDYNALSRLIRKCVYTAPPPSVPEPKYPDDGNGDDDAYNAGWNACRAAMLAAAPSAKEVE